MRVLILSITAGYGHHAAAKAVSDALEARDASVVTVDLLQYVSKFLFDTVDKGYLISTQYAKRPYRMAYTALENRHRLRQASTLMQEFISRKFSKFFKGYLPDLIICTHPFAAQTIHELKLKGIIETPAIGIITDYTIHPFWEEVGRIEYIVTASELLSYLAVKKGISENRLLPIGIPIQSKFNKKLDKEKARSQLGLNPEGHVVLVMGGSMGHGDMVDLVSQIDQMNMGFQIACICGNNVKLYRKLKLLKTKNPMYVFGFVDNVEVFMDAADCIVTKPGGLTVTEAMSKKLPMILVNPIPGHEERNIEFLVNSGVAVRVTENFSVPEAIYFLISNPKRLEIMGKALELVAHPDAAEQLCDFIFNMGL